MITITDRQGVLGTIELAGGRLTGSTGTVQRLADQVLASAGSPQAAYDALALIDNGYVRAVPAAEVVGLAAQAIEMFNPGQLRDSHGRWTIGAQAARNEPPRMQQAIEGRFHASGAGAGPFTSGRFREPGAVPGKPVPGPGGQPSARFRREITAAEARGNSRPVTSAEFQHLAALGNAQLDRMKRDRAPVTAMEQNWPQIKASTYGKVQQPWGGATISSHTGQSLPDGADKYALSVKPASMQTVSVPETASQAEFSAAMDRALAQFRPVLERRSFYLGVFHDDENHRIDIDPVAVVDTTYEVETLGAYTHAIGGAYHFRSGDGFWPPHVAKAAEMSASRQVHWKGPGQWHSAAITAQVGTSTDEIEPFETITSQAAAGLVSEQLDLASSPAARREDEHK